jgi:hypothetical protein
VVPGPPGPITGAAAAGSSAGPAYAVTADKLLHTTDRDKQVAKAPFRSRR